MKERMKSPKFWVTLALILCLVCMIGASCLQTLGGRVKYQSVEWNAESGIKVAANMYIPKTATEENPAPAVVVSHGAQHHSEMTDAYSIELARRGFVVMAIDMVGHGDSEYMTAANSTNNANGLYDGVRYLSRLPYVDAARIGLTGHSMGGMMTNQAVALDEQAETPLISAIMLLSADPAYTDEEGNYQNQYGTRDAGIVAVLYEEFFHRQKYADGTVAPTNDFINTLAAQSFLYAGTDPTGKEVRVADTMYYDEIDGVEAIRTIWTPTNIHPGALYSPLGVEGTVDFFCEALDAPNSFDGGNQIWGWKFLFNTIGVIGFGMFVIGFALLLLKTKYFGVLNNTEEKILEPAVLDTKGKKLWYWGGMVVLAVIGILIWPPIYKWSKVFTIGFFNQAHSWSLGLFSLAIALLTAVFLLVYYYAFGKKNGFDAKAAGLKLNARKLWISIVYGVVVSAASYLLVYLAEFFTKTDFRCWIITIKTFEVERFAEFFKYFPFFFLFCLAISISANSFNYVKVGKNDKGGRNLAIQCISATIVPIFYLAIQYLTFFSTGYMWSETALGLNGQVCIYIIAFPVMVPFCVACTRAIYKRTNNPYAGAILMGILFTLIQVTGTITSAPV